MLHDRQLILVTGADGFIGSALCGELLRKEVRVRAACRRLPIYPKAQSQQRMEIIAVGPISADTDWKLALEGIDIVIHLAARTHTPHENASDALEKYRQTNVKATERFARTAAECGVKRFVFMSSVKVNGERTLGRPFAEDSTPKPEDEYGISKWEAEQALAQVAVETGLEIVVIRPPLVYGPGVKGNFLRLTRIVARGIPLPLASVVNRRSIIYVGNLVEAVICCVEAPTAASKTYLVSDGKDVSTPELVWALAAALGVPARLFPFPSAFLKLGAVALGKGEEIARLTESLEVDSSGIQNELGWRPRFSLTEGLAQTALWFGSVAGKRRWSIK